MLKEVAKKYNMVILNSLLERDDSKGVIFNATAVISNNGKYMGKYRKSHIPRVIKINVFFCYLFKLNVCDIYL